MKIFIMLVSMFLTTGIFSQSKMLVFDAIQKSDMNALALLLDKKVEYCFDDQIQFLETEAAVKAIRAFLSVNVPKTVTPMHKGASKMEDSNFAIATMESMNGRKFRIYVYAENSGGKLLVQELRIDIQR